MKHGFVKKLNKTNGEGYIEIITGKQYKFHLNTVDPEIRSEIFEGSVVEFEIFNVLGHPVPLHITLSKASNILKGRIA